VAGKTGQAHHGDSACGGESGVWAVVAEVAERPADGDGWGATFCRGLRGIVVRPSSGAGAPTSPAAAEKLLAQAYTQKRTLELRMAGRSPIMPRSRIARSGGSFTDSPKELLNAEALIASQLESQSASPSWCRRRRKRTCWKAGTMRRFAHCCMPRSWSRNRRPS